MKLFDLLFNQVIVRTLHTESEWKLLQINYNDNDIFIWIHQSCVRVYGANVLRLGKFSWACVIAW